MKSYTVSTSVNTLRGQIFVGDPVVLNEKELEQITATVNTRHVIRITLTRGPKITQKFIPIQAIDYIEVNAKENEEEKK